MKKKMDPCAEHGVNGQQLLGTHMEQDEIKKETIVLGS